MKSLVLFTLILSVFSSFARIVPVPEDEEVKCKQYKSIAAQAVVLSSFKECLDYYDIVKRFKIKGESGVTGEEYNICFRKYVSDIKFLQKEGSRIREVDYRGIHFGGQMTVRDRDRFKKPGYKTRHTRRIKRGKGIAGTMIMNTGLYDNLLNFDEEESWQVDLERMKELNQIKRDRERARKKAVERARIRRAEFISEQKQEARERETRQGGVSVK